MVYGLNKEPPLTPPEDDTRESEARERITDEAVKEWWELYLDGMGGDAGQIRKWAGGLSVWDGATKVRLVQEALAGPLSTLYFKSDHENGAHKALRLCMEMDEIAIKDILKERFGITI